VGTRQLAHRFTLPLREGQKSRRDFGVGSLKLEPRIVTARVSDKQSFSMPQPEGRRLSRRRAYVYGRRDLVDFLKVVFEAEVTHRGTDPDTFHGEVKIGDSIAMVGIGKSIPPEFALPSKWGVRADSKAPHPSTVYVYASDVDAAYQRALGMGAASLNEPIDLAWSDRVAGVRGSCGNCWWIATFKARK